VVDPVPSGLAAGSRSATSTGPRPVRKIRLIVFRHGGWCLRWWPVDGRRSGRSGHVRLLSGRWPGGSPRLPVTGCSSDPSGTGREVASRHAPRADTIGGYAPL